MITIGIDDAKTQLPELIERISHGERFVITDHGRPIAELVPPRAGNSPEVSEILDRMSEWQEREGPTLGPGLSIRELREEGRRF